MTMESLDNPLDINAAVELHATIHERQGLDPLAFYTEYDAFRLAQLTSNFTQSVSINSLLSRIYVVQTLFNSVASINSSTSFTDIVTQSITVGAGKVLVLGFGNIDESKSGANDLQHAFAVYRDSTLLGVTATNQWGGTFGGAGSGVKSGATLFILDSPGAGSYTYRIKGTYGNLSTSGTPVARGMLMLAELSA